VVLGSTGHEHLRRQMHKMPGGETASFVFSISNEDADQSPTPAQQLEFQFDFARELESVKTWALRNNWSPAPVPEFHVVVSPKYRISRALFPAWSGRLGHMEFPARRVKSRAAAIAHELTHVLLPNGNRFLAEGLAIYIQAKIGSNPAFPNFGQPLHDLVRKRLADLFPDVSSASTRSIHQLQLSELDKIATPNPLAIKIGSAFYGEEPLGQAIVYPIAGSFVQFIIESHGLSLFKDMYLETLLIPLEQNAGLPDRWLGIYKVSLHDLEQEWKEAIVTGRA
jgi:hypothetical protein